MFGFRKPDRTERNISDGQLFNGYDNEDGTTTYYDSEGNLDSITKTPTKDEQDMIDYYK